MPVIFVSQSHYSLVRIIVKVHRDSSGCFPCRRLSLCLAIAKHPVSPKHLFPALFNFQIKPPIKQAVSLP